MHRIGGIKLNIPPPPAQTTEINEGNIDWITISWFGSSYQHRPVDGAAKWFRDELGQNWVKIRINSGDAGIRTIVFQADLVQEVAYNPRAPS